MAKRPPLIADVKRNSLDDGPGIRSVVFFKGCPLRCVWCQNPETLSTRAEIQRDPDRCQNCGACLTACPEGIARPGAEPEARERCRRCGACAEACVTNVRRLTGRAWPLDELTGLLARDAPFYRTSGGGVTLSGGEPTLHVRYAGEVAAELQAKGIAVLLETCGLFAWGPFEEHLLPHLTTVYFDLKLGDPDRHRQHTGHDNRRITDNLTRLAKRAEPELLARVPLIPGITDDEENLRAIAALALDAGLERLALLPYNPLWLPKRRGLGGDLPYEHDRFMSDEEVARCEEVIRQAGLTVVKG